MDKVFKVVLADDIGKTLTLSDENKVEVKVAKNANNAIEVQSGGLMVDISELRNLVEDLQAELDKEIGVAKAFPSTVVPFGYLIMDGQEFDTSRYPKLASMYPSGKLPDLRGVFIRGSNDGAGRDPLSFELGTLVPCDLNEGDNKYRVVSFSNVNLDDINADNPYDSKYYPNGAPVLAPNIMVASVEATSRNATEIRQLGNYGKLGITRPTNIAFVFACRAG